MDRENRLKQQRERFQLIDEMIKEAEKKSKTQSSEFFNGTAASNTQQVVNNIKYIVFCVLYLKNTYIKTTIFQQAVKL